MNFESLVKWSWVFLLSGNYEYKALPDYNFKDSVITAMRRQQSRYNSSI